MIYLDYAATTPIRPEVLDVLYQSLEEDFANPSSTYRVGRDSKQKIRLARKSLGRVLNVNDRSIYFTSGATESNNWALKTQAITARKQSGKNHIVTTAIEHPSVGEVMEYLESIGFQVTYITPDSAGNIIAQDFIDATSDQTIMWSLMGVNNEVGSILPFQEVGQAAKERGLMYHIDAVQALGHIDLDLANTYFTSLSLTGHKLGGPKGVGVLIYQGKKTLQPYLHGGGQEFTKRSGTENTPYIVAFSKSVELAIAEEDQNINHYYKLEKLLYQELNSAGVDYQKNGPQTNKVSHINNIWVKNLPASLALIKLDLNDIYVSAGSACSAGSIEPSHVLSSYYPGQDDRLSQSLRISFGPATNEEQIREFAHTLGQIQKGSI